MSKMSKKHEHWNCLWPCVPYTSTITQQQPRLHSVFGVQMSPKPKRKEPVGLLSQGNLEVPSVGSDRTEISTIAEKITRLRPSSASEEVELENFCIFEARG